MGLGTVWGSWTLCPKCLQTSWHQGAAAPSDFSPLQTPQEVTSRMGSLPGTDWELLSPSSVTPPPGPVSGPRQDQEIRQGALEGDRSLACRKEAGLQPNQDLWAPIIIMKERKKKGTRVRQCPGTRTAALLPKMSKLSTLQISIKHAVLHRFACHLHANDLTPQCAQSPKQLLVLAFLLAPAPCLALRKPGNLGSKLGWATHPCGAWASSCLPVSLSFPDCEPKETN